MRGFWIRSRSCLRPAADEAPRRTRGKTSGTQGNKSSKTLKKPPKNYYTVEEGINDTKNTKESRD